MIEFRCSNPSRPGGSRLTPPSSSLPSLQVPTSEGSLPEYAANAGDSCFFCKSSLYTTLHNVAQRATERHSGMGDVARQGVDECEGLDDVAGQGPQLQLMPSASWDGSRRIILFNGTNADDLTDPTRLGLLAALKCHVASPIACLTKAAVRVSTTHWVASAVQ